MNHRDYSILALLPLRLALLDDILAHISPPSRATTRTATAWKALYAHAEQTRAILLAQHSDLLERLPRAAQTRLAQIQAAGELISHARDGTSLTPEAIAVMIAAAERPLSPEQMGDLDKLLISLRSVD